MNICRAITLVPKTISSFSVISIATDEMMPPSAGEITYEGDAGRTSRCLTAVDAGRKVYLGSSYWKLINKKLRYMGAVAIQGKLLSG